jgi:hypothetical protein
MSGSQMRQNKQAIKMVVSDANKQQFEHQQLLQNHQQAVAFNAKALKAIQGPYNQNSAYSVETLYTHVDNVLNNKADAVDTTGWSDGDKGQFLQDTHDILEQNKIQAGWNAYKAFKQSSDTIKQIEAMPQFKTTSSSS